MKKISIVIVHIFAVIGFILMLGYISVNSGLTKTSGIIDGQHDYFQNQIQNSMSADTWNSGEEWIILKEAILRDKEVINKASLVSGVPARLIVTPLVIEQLRLFHSDRELFKKAFAPLKILGNQSQFSWGIMGIKQETARRIETNLREKKSPWYPGEEYEHLLDFKTDNPNKERFDRLTNDGDRYFSYLYASLMMKQLTSQWKKAGFPISDRPGIIATLFNIGFENSKPHANPQSGGAEIEINKTTYSFGGLAKIFYESKELLNEFPTSSLLQ